MFIVGRSLLEGLWPAFDYKMNAGAMQEFSSVMKDPLAGTGIFSGKKMTKSEIHVIMNSCGPGCGQPGTDACNHQQEARTDDKQSDGYLR